MAGRTWRTLVTRFESGREQRRSKSDAPRRGFHLEFNAIPESTANAIRVFFDSRKGSWDSFSFTNPADGVTSTVRFADDTFRLEHVATGICCLTIDLVEVL